MKSDLQELENNEAILLMYLADELTADDRAEVELMLAGDAGLRAEMESLRETKELLWKQLARLDVVTRPVISEMRAIRGVSGLIRRWTDTRQPATSLAIEQNRRPFAWRRWSLSAAAVLLVGVYMWFAYHPNEPNGVVRNQPLVRDLPQQEKLALLANSLDDSNSEESSNVQLAEVAAIMPGAGDVDSSIGGNNGNPN